VRHRDPLLEPPLDVAPLECSLVELGPLEIREVRHRPGEAIFDRLLQTYRPESSLAFCVSRVIAHDDLASNPGAEGGLYDIPTEGLARSK
jgi:hypothetical protein